MGAKGRVGGQVNPPLPPESTEVIHVRPAHESLQRGVEVSYVDTLLQSSFTIDFDENLRHPRAELRVDGPDFRLLPGGLDEPNHLTLEVFGGPAATILKHEAETGGRSDSRNGRWRECEGSGLRQRTEPAGETLYDVGHLCWLRPSLV